MKNCETKTEYRAQDDCDLEYGVTLDVNALRVGSVEFCHSLACQVSSRTAIGAWGFGGFDLGHIPQVARHLLNVDSSVLVATRSNRGPASEVSTLGFNNHRVFGTDFFDSAPRNVDARDGVFDSDSRIGEVNLGSVEQEVNSEKSSCASGRDLEGIVVRIDEQGVNEEHYKDIAEDCAVERAIWPELCWICAVVNQFAECGLVHE